MIEIICGTNRPGSRSLEICKILQGMYKEIEEPSQILDLRDIEFTAIEKPYSDEKPQSLIDAVERVNQSKALVLVCPEYNGSYPGILKYFIDHWAYPLSFEYRPVSFVGLGGRFGALRPIEHLQGVFGYRNAYMFPERVFIGNVWGVLKDGKIEDEHINELLQKQVSDFSKFIKGLQSQGLDAHSRARAGV